MRPSYPRPLLTAGREDEQVHKTAILEGLTAGVKSAFNGGSLLYAHNYFEKKVGILVGWPLILAQDIGL